MVTKLISIKSVIAKIIADLDLKEDDTKITDIREWCSEAIEKIGAVTQFIPKVKLGEEISIDIVKDKKNYSIGKRCDYLNSLGIKTLKYFSSNGTNFKVGLIEDALFMGGGEKTLLGNFFNPNILIMGCSLFYIILLFVNFLVEKR